MARESFPPVSVLPVEEDVRIPAEAHTLDGFRRWCQDDDFPERGRIDYLQGDVEVDLSPEHPLTHGTPKMAIGGRLQALVMEPELGLVFIDGTRVVSPAAGLSVEPDVVVVLNKSFATGRVRGVPSSRRPGEAVELEGTPDLVVELVSDSSVGKDRKRLPRLYALAGVPELWLADARGELPLFEIWTLGPAGYTRVAPDSPGPDAWTTSPLLAYRFRLRSHKPEGSGITYWKLESEPTRRP